MWARCLRALHLGLVVATVAVGLAFIAGAPDAKWGAGGALLVLALLGLPWSLPAFIDETSFPAVPAGVTVYCLIFAVVNVGLHWAIAAFLSRHLQQPGAGPSGADGAGVREPRSPAPTAPGRRRS